MDILITENQFKCLVNYIIKEETDREKTEKQFYKGVEVEKWFINLMEQLETKEERDMIIYEHKKNKRIYMAYIKDDKELYIDYDEIWAYIENNYSADPYEFEQFIKSLAEKHLDLYNITPVMWDKEYT